jgi:DNA polymerase elongation subunit (family B)
MSSTTDYYTFQVIDWYSENYDKRDNDESEDTYGGYKQYNDDDSDNETEEFDEETGRTIHFDEETGEEIAQQELSAKYVIYITGRDIEGHTYSLEVRDFTPYFYVRAPDHVKQSHIPIFERWLRENMSKRHAEGLLSVSLFEKKSFRNFDNNKYYKFFRMVFNNTNAMKNAVSLFQERVADNRDDKNKKVYPKRNTMITGITSGRGFQFDIHENMVDPLLKFIHIKSIKPVGWIRIPKSKVSKRDTIPTHCEHNLSVFWKDIEAIEQEKNAPFKVLAFDIECDSAHGDFPIPIKDYTKLGREIYMTYIRMEKKYNELKQAIRILDRNIQATIQVQEEEKKAKGKKVQLSVETTLVENIEEAKQELEDYQYQYDLLEQLIQSKKEYCWACIHTAFGLVPSDVAEVDSCELEIGRYEWIPFYKSYFADISVVYPKKAGAKPDAKVINRVITVIEKKLFVPTEEKSLERKATQSKSIQHIIDSLNKNFPALEGDHTIQIGLSFIEYGKTVPYKNYMITVGTCTPLHNAETIECNTEKELLLRFREVLLKEDPDIITGYNIDGFDTAWLFKRAKECGIEQTFARLSRFADFVSVLKERQVKSATGELVRREYVDLPGRIQLDIMPQVQKGYNLESYKLDDVSAEFMNGKVESTEYDEKTNMTTVYTNAVKGLHERNYVMFNEIDGYLEKKYKDGQKFEVIEMGSTDGKKWFRVQSEVRLNMSRKCMWCLGKDDTSPSDIFRLQKGTAEDRYIIAKYCMMDVILCIELLNKLELLNNNIGMANVCMNPLSWIINRGQGVKILSLVAFFIRKKDYLLPYLYKDLFDRESYEGAVVLDPMPNIYLDDPISVLDYGSLYPSSMIERNLSHETIIDPKRNPEYTSESGKELLDKLGFDVEDITYDTYGYVNNAKVKTGVKTVRYVQFRDGSKGIIPQILQYLIKNRKDTRNKIAYQTCTLSNGKVVVGMYNEKKRMIISDKEKYEIPEGVSVVSAEETYNEFQQKVLDGLQLAFKITANSLYGQVGAKTSDIYYKEIAASTTATGRERLIQAKEYAENTMNYPQKLNDGRTIYLQNKVIYGDTDSVFVRFQCLDDDGKPLRGREARSKSIKLAIQTEHAIQETILRAPQVLEYEKTFHPFILFSKKRYIGDLYEFDPDKFSRKSMGIVLKRRDNAPIVKVVYGKIIDIIMKEQNIQKAVRSFQYELKELAAQRVDVDTLIITKTLSSFYKDPDRVAHKVLAERMAERDPGNKPLTGDRIPFVYIKKKGKNILQGDRIEHPDYYKQQLADPSLTKDVMKIDAEFYIMNQIRKPVTQIFALCIDKLPGFKGDMKVYEKKYRELMDTGKYVINECLKRTNELKRRDAEKLIMEEVLRILDNQRNKVNPIEFYFKKMTKAKPEIEEIAE